MAECFKCGITGDKVMLFDAISANGIVKICGRCSSEEDIPVIKKPAGQEFSKTPELRNQEMSLRKLVDRNIPVKGRKDFPDLIDNFHWIIMRARKLKHMTQEQLGREIGESEKIIKLSERGFLPDNYHEFIRKIEDVLRVRLFKKEAAEKMKEQTKRFGFDPLTTRSLTISDLQEMKKKREAEIIEGDDEYFFDEDFNEDAEENEDEPEFVKKGRDLSRKEMDRILFRK
jgi:ribosome-binding protein aMBF1 (putative translation factor)